MRRTQRVELSSYDSTVNSPVWEGTYYFPHLSYHRTFLTLTDRMTEFSATCISGKYMLYNYTISLGAKEKENEKKISQVIELYK